MRTSRLPHPVHSFRLQLVLAVLLFVPVHWAQAADLFGTSLNGASNASPGPSTLYSINQATGAGTPIGSIGHAVNGLAFDPTTGTLYGSTTSWSPGFPNGLLTINPLTGAATTIGTGFGTSFVGNITVDSTGRMFGAVQGGASFVSINKATGVATVIGPGPFGAGPSTLSFDNADGLKFVQVFRLYSINTSNGGGTQVGAITTGPLIHGDFHPDTGLLWSLLTSGATQNSMVGVTNVVTDSTTTIDTNVTYLHTLAFRSATGLALAGFTLKKSSIAGCKSVAATVSLSAPAPVGGISVTISDDLAAANPPLTVKVAQGATSKNFSIKTTEVAVAEPGEVSATLGAVTIDRSLTVKPMAIASVALSPTTVKGGNSVNGTAKLDCKAGPGPILVHLSSSLPAVANPTVPSILVPVGVQTVPFLVTTSPVAATTKPKIRGSANGVTKSKSLTVNP